METNGNGLTPQERSLNKKINLHAWIASLVSMLGVLIVVFTVYGKANTAIDNNTSDHKRLFAKDSIQDIQITKSLRTLDVIYFNQLEMARRMNIKLTKEEEMFLNQLIK